jgi:hypothetical protein
MGWETERERERDPTLPVKTLAELKNGLGLGLGQSIIGVERARQKCRVPVHLADTYGIAARTLAHKGISHLGGATGMGRGSRIKKEEERKKETKEERSRIARHCRGAGSRVKLLTRLGGSIDQAHVVRYKLPPLHGNEGPEIVLDVDVREESEADCPGVGQGVAALGHRRRVNV